MATSPEMSVFKLRVNRKLLHCKYCGRPLRREGAKPLKCAGGHIFCESCFIPHEVDCLSESISLHRIIGKMKFKYCCCEAGRQYIPYSELARHPCDVDPAGRHNFWERVIKSSINPFRAWGECIIETSALVCSECRVPLRPPIFTHVSRDGPFCSDCSRGDITNYLRCSELDYLIQGTSVECEACKEYVPFRTLASHQLDNCRFKHRLQKIALGSSALKSLCDEEETTRTKAGSNSIHGKNKRRPPLEAGTDEVGNDDLCDDNHGTCEDVFSCVHGSNDKMDEWERVGNPETVKRVAENSFKTPCEKAEKAQAPSKQPLQLFVPRRPVTRSRKRA